MIDDELPDWHPETFHLPPDFWSWPRVLVLIATETMWATHVTSVLDAYEAADDDAVVDADAVVVVTGWTDGGSWLEASMTAAAIAAFAPCGWWPRRDS